jgi:hypothetical protein
MQDTSLQHLHSNPGLLHLINHSYLAHNILVVVDFDGFEAVPVNIVGTCSPHMFMTIFPLGHVSIKPAVIQHVDFEKPTNKC